MTEHVRTIDGPGICCSFHTWDCSDKAAQAGGFDEHHAWPKAMGGPENPDDLLILCATHHRRQHALIRAYAQWGTGVQMVKWFSKQERDTAKWAVEMWRSIGSPHVYWNVPAAAVQL